MYNIIKDININIIKEDTTKDINKDINKLVTKVVTKLVTKDETPENNYIFTVDWFSYNIPIWTHYLNHLKNEPNLHFLEIGSFQGRSTVWLLENILTNNTSKITCIDTFEGSIEHTINFQNDIKNLFDIFSHNISKFKNKVNIIKNKSQNALKHINDKYDFIYIDGDHKASSVIEDAILSFSLLKKGGIMIFDDYMWFEMKKYIDNPKIAIDAFLEIYADKITILYKNCQVIIEKI